MYTLSTEEGTLGLKKHRLRYVWTSHYSFTHDGSVDRTEQIIVKKVNDDDTLRAGIRSAKVSTLSERDFQRVGVTEQYLYLILVLNLGMKIR